MIRAVVVLLCGLAAACVEPFSGSKLEILFAGGVSLPGSGEPGAPPSEAHLEFYAVRDGVPLHLFNAGYAPVVSASEPCFIELEGTADPLTGADLAGLHSTQWYAKLLELYQADGDVTDVEASVLALAAERVGADIPALEGGVKVLVDTGYGPPTGDEVPQQALAELAAELPPIAALDDASNRQRLERCLAFFRAYPSYYVGTDRLITKPINGTFFGPADGTDPRSSGFIGGASVSIEARLDPFDALRVNWQFDDPADPRAAALGESPVGYHYMAGQPESRVRGVTNVEVVNDTFVRISAAIGIFTNLDDDNVHF
jgi:hypothetical protein